jgi:hypothetical protein
MDQITDKTSITDLSAINIPKCYEKYVNKAMCKSSKLLTMKEFIDKTEFNIHPETFDILFMNINDEGIPIYIDEAMLDWMGYKGVETKIKLLSLKNHIKRNFEEDVDYKILKNSDYAKYLKEETEKIKSNLPPPAISTSARSIKHLIVMPDAFKRLCMMINTSRGAYIKQYYIDLEKLVQAYFIYQSIFNGLNYKKELDSLKKCNHIQEYTKMINIQRLNEEIKNYNRYGDVYYIQEELSKNIKIGYTYNLNERLNTLQVANSSKLTIIHTINCKNPYSHEQYLHKKYEKYHIRGEWYKCAILDVSKFEFDILNYTNPKDIK